MSADIPGIRHEAVSTWLAANVPEIQLPLQFHPLVTKNNSVERVSLRWPLHTISLALPKL